MHPMIGAGKQCFKETYSLMEYGISKSFASLAPSAIREILKVTADPEVIAFSAGNPSPDSFPLEAIRRLSSDIFARQSTMALQYGTSEGYGPLREVLSARLRERRQIASEGNTLVMTAGGQQALELTCRVLCNQGDVVLCEDPSFIGALNAFRAAGVRLVGIPMERDGMNTDALERALRKYSRAKMLYTIPNFHNPSGICTSLEKRKKIYELAQKYGIIILEDDPYGEIRFAGRDIPTIKSLDVQGEERVVYASSFSKLVSPGMRVGYAVAPAQIAAKMVVGKQCEDVHTNQFFQMLCHRFMTEYKYDEHIARIRALYLRKSTVMTDALLRYMPKSLLTFGKPEGGLFVFCTLDDSVNADVFRRTALARKVAFVPGEVFSVSGTCHQSFRLTYATPTDEQIERGVRILSEALSPLT